MQNGMHATSRYNNTLLTLPPESVFLFHTWHKLKLISEVAHHVD